MKKLVVLDDFPIVPPNHGGKLRIYNIYKQLSEIYNITYICLGDGRAVKETKITDTFKEVQVPKLVFQKTLEIMAGKILGVSIDDIIAMILCGINPSIKSEVKRNLIDCSLIILAQPYLYYAIHNNLSNKILLYDSQNVEYLLKKTILGKGHIQKIILNSVKYIEKKAIDRSKVIFVTSSLDRDAFKEVYGLNEAKIHISPNGANISFFDELCQNGVFDKETVSSKPIAIFIGSGHPPNVEAAKAIVRSIAPALCEIYFLICGSVCWGVKNEFLPNNVGLTFEVTEEEKLELFRSSNVALNPMQSGSGTNIKMLDYMAAGLPVITTPIGARGLDLNCTTSVICEIAQFPENIREILNNKELYNTLRCNGRKLVEEKYDWSKIARNMADVFKKIDLQQ